MIGSSGFFSTALVIATRLSRAVLLVVCLSPWLGCRLLSTSDDEAVPGRGPKAFDPYSATLTDGIRLSLFMFNGCAVLPTGETAANSSPNIPYPASCDPLHPDQFKPQRPNRPLKLFAGTKYFLNQLILMHVEQNVHTPNDLTTIHTWFQNLPKFGKLNWSGVGRNVEQWWPSSISPTPLAWRRDVFWSDAAWQNETEDSFLVEVVDGDGQLRASTVYRRKDFLVENPAFLHTVYGWEHDNIAAPVTPTDTNYKPAPPSPAGFPPTGAPFTKTFFKFEMVTNSNPFNTIEIPSGVSSGAIRVTWSQLPDDPFYFPATFTAPNEVEPTCFDAADPTKKVRCGPGVVPEVAFTRPANDKFYVPGETVQFTLSAKDALGNLLHPPGTFPSYNDYLDDRSNGILYFNNFNLITAHDMDTMSSFQFGGPKQKLFPYSELLGSPFYSGPTDAFVPGSRSEGLAPLGNVQTAMNAIPGARDRKIPALYHFTVPPNAEPGTYVFVSKINRYFMGERFTKARFFEFQVGQDEATEMPGRVGNCQMCHRGTLTLDNVRHGLPVDFVEGCKVCHNRQVVPGGRSTFNSMIHRVHMTSTKYPLPKGQCTTCHLTRESTLKPTVLTCSGCHQHLHGGKYDYLVQTSEVDPLMKDTVYSSCGNACHVTSPPTAHVMPEQ